MFRIRLKELREQKGLNQREFAKALDISPSTVGMWESGEREPKNLALLKRIADYFEVPVDALLNDQAAIENPASVSADGPDSELWELIKRIPDDRMPEVERYLRFQAEQREKP